MRLHENTPVVYICSPFRGATPDEQTANIENAKRYGRYAIANGAIPFIAHLAICGFLDDSDPEQRKLGMQADLIMLNHCAELWVFGDKISSGMKAEIDYCTQKNIPIRYYTTDCQPLSGLKG